MSAGALNASLADLGWDEGLATAFAEHAQTGRRPARVIVAHRDACEVAWEGSEGPGPTNHLLATVTGRFRHEALSPTDFPVVGDWAAIEPRPDEGTASIHAVLPRRTLISRREPGWGITGEQVLAANVDVVFVTTSLNRDLNARRLERYLAVAWESGAKPVLLLTKADLATDPVELAVAETELESVAAGVPIHVVSGRTGIGLGGLASYLGTGSTVVLIGSSGVGKSTLINALLGQERLLTREIREDDARGRHTTTSRELVLLPGGAALIDTPGLRQVGLWDDEAGLTAAFADVDDLAGRCRFADCGHRREPGCAVLEAVEDGNLAPGRLESWRRLMREERHRELERDALARRQERRRWAVIGRAGAAQAAAKRGGWGQ